MEYIIYSVVFSIFDCERNSVENWVYGKTPYRMYLSISRRFTEKSPCAYKWSFGKYPIKADFVDKYKWTVDRLYGIQ